MAADCRSSHAVGPFPAEPPRPLPTSRTTRSSMASLLDRKLLFVTGKGGVGKTTMSCAIALLGAREGRRTVVVEVGEQSRLPGLFGVEPPAPGMVAELGDGVSSISIDPDRALLEWLQALGGRIPGRVL